MKPQLTVSEKTKKTFHFCTAGYEQHCKKSMQESTIRKKTTDLLQKMSSNKEIDFHFLTEKKLN